MNETITIPAWTIFPILAAIIFYGIGYVAHEAKDVGWTTAIFGEPLKDKPKPDAGYLALRRARRREQDRELQRLLLEELRASDPVHGNEAKPYYGEDSP